MEGENVDVLNAVVRFDPFTNAWEEVATMATAGPRYVLPWPGEEDGRLVGVAEGELEGAAERAG